MATSPLHINLKYNLNYMACLPVVFHITISCLLGLCYGLGYVSSIATYELYNKRKRKQSCDEGEDKAGQESDEKKEEEKTPESSVSVDEVIKTLETIKNELLERKEKEIELTNQSNPMFREENKIFY